MPTSFHQMPERLAAVQGRRSRLTTPTKVGAALAQGGTRRALAGTLSGWHASCIFARTCALPRRPQARSLRVLLLLLFAFLGCLCYPLSAGAIPPAPNE